jgi:polar amino acid transport system substrate-binding protein
VNGRARPGGFVGSAAARVIAAIALALACFAFAACGGDDATPASTGSTTGGTQSAASLLPDDIKSRGSITAAVAAEYPPWQYLDEQKRIVGLEVDIADAVARKLGVTLDYSNVGFDSIIPGLQSHRYDLGTSTVTDTKERQQVVDFVDFYRKVNVLMVRAGNPDGIHGLDDVCGKVAATQAGTDWSQMLQAQNDKCKSEGKPEIQLKQFPLNTDTALSVQSDRAQTTLEDYVSAAYRAAQSRGKLEVLTEETYAPALYGFAFQKGSPLAKAWQAGLREVIDDGTYDQIFEKWRVRLGLLRTAGMNGGTT